MHWLFSHYSSAFWIQIFMNHHDLYLAATVNIKNNPIGKSPHPYPQKTIPPLPPPPPTPSSHPLQSPRTYTLLYLFFRLATSHPGLNTPKNNSRISLSFCCTQKQCTTHPTYTNIPLKRWRWQWRRNGRWRHYGYLRVGWGRSCPRLLRWRWLWLRWWLLRQRLLLLLLYGGSWRLALRLRASGAPTLILPGNHANTTGKDVQHKSSAAAQQHMQSCSTSIVMHSVQGFLCAQSFPG